MALASLNPGSTSWVRHQLKKASITGRNSDCRLTSRSSGVNSAMLLLSGIADYNSLNQLLPNSLSTAWVSLRRIFVAHGPNNRLISHFRVDDKPHAYHNEHTPSSRLRVLLSPVHSA